MRAKAEIEHSSHRGYTVPCASGAEEIIFHLGFEGDIFLGMDIPSEASPFKLFNR